MNKNNKSAKPDNAIQSPHENAEVGIKLNKKTMIIISLLLFAIMVFAGVLTQVMPRGEYQTQMLDGHESIINGTYTEIDYTMPIWKIILAPILVFASSEATTGLAIILFIVLIGGTFLILDKVGALKYIMSVIIKKFGSRKYLLLAIMVFVCMLLSSTAGILEESVTLVPIAVAISLALGWDSFVGLGISLFSIAFGFTAATFNPFNVMTVQKLAGLEVFSGLWLRIIVFAAVYAVLTGYLIVYAKKIEKHPEKSLSYENDKQLRRKFSLDESDALLSDPAVRKATRSFVFCLCGVLLFIVLDFILEAGGMISLPAMALLFTAGGLLAGYNAGLRGKKLAKSFGAGIKSIAPALPLIIFVIAISYILKEGKIIHTILNFVYNIVSGFNPYQSILLLFLFVVVLEFFIGSGTAKAFLIMPLVAPLADLVGVTRQSVVLSFCLGDGFTNLLYPTSGIMIIAIGLVGISYGKWLRWSWKLFALEGVISVAFMLLAVAVNYH